jgi:hypothetical protein
MKYAKQYDTEDKRTALKALRDLTNEPLPLCAQGDPYVKEHFNHTRTKPDNEEVFI